jgi:hypothetical protein
MSSVLYPLFLSDFHDILIFSIDFRKILKSNFKKIRAVGAELLHEYGLIVAFRKFATAPKKFNKHAEKGGEEEKGMKYLRHLGK